MKEMKLKPEYEIEICTRTAEQIQNHVLSGVGVKLCPFFCGGDNGCDRVKIRVRPTKATVIA